MNILPSRSQAEILSALDRSGPLTLADYHRRSLEVCRHRKWIARDPARPVSKFILTAAGIAALKAYRDAYH